MVGPAEVNDEVLSMRNLTTMRNKLGFSTLTEMKDYVSNSPTFAPYFNEYAERCIFPQQAAALRWGGARTKGPALITVERRLTAGETGGDNKFSTHYPDKSDWDNIDHCAHMLYGLRQSNTRNARGLFFGKHLDQPTIHNRLWALLKWWEYEHSPSRMEKSSKGKVTLPNKRKAGAVLDKPSAGGMPRPLRHPISPQLRLPIPDHLS